MLQKVQSYITQHGLLSYESKYLVALSGGADSVALLRIMLELGYKVEAAHCNFNLRGEESNRDEEFCQQLCHEMGVELHIVHFDTRTYADLHKVSIEMAARKLRYNYFHQLLHDLNLEGVCVAHHRDDSVETILLNLIRGTGIEGLTGISPRNGNTIRPLLCLSRAEILQYLPSGSQTFITDSSNLVADVQRNQIRLEIIPLLKKINSAAIENINRCSHHVANACQILNATLEESTKRCCKIAEGTTIIDIEKLKAELGQEAILWHILSDKGFNSSQVEQIAESLDAESGKRWFSTTHTLLKDRNVFIISPAKQEEFKPVRIPETGNYIINNKCKIRIQPIKENEEIVFDRTNRRIYVDADKVQFPLTIRTIKNGDWFIPFGMNGRKLVSDFLTDLKANLFEKSQQTVLTDATDMIIWLPGRRTDNRFCITPKTSRIIKIEIE